MTITDLEKGDRLIKFNVEVSEKEGEKIAEGTHERFVVDSTKFLARANAKVMC